MGSNVKDLISDRLPPYEYPPPWIPPHEREHHPDYNSDLEQFLPRNISLQRNEASEQTFYRGILCDDSNSTSARVAGERLDILGFNIRGGKEHHCGIYVSKVMPGSEAERLGLHEGDQILSVNGVGFETIEHAEAVKTLKKDSKIWMTVRNFPYGYHQTYDKS